MDGCAEGSYQQRFAATVPAEEASGGGISGRRGQAPHCNVHSTTLQIAVKCSRCGSQDVSPRLYRPVSGEWFPPAGLGAYNCTDGAPCVHARLQELVSISRPSSDFGLL